MMFLNSILPLLPFLGALVVPISATPLHQRQAPQATGSLGDGVPNGPLQTGVAPSLNSKGTSFSHLLQHG